MRNINPTPRHLAVDPVASRKIDALGFVCACLVVAIHTKGEDGGFVVDFIKHFANIAVPFFFTVSGYFIARHFNDQGCWLRESRKRVRTILVPYLIWCLLTALAVLPLSLMCDMIQGKKFGASVSTTALNLFGFDFRSTPQANQLWYLRCLMVFVLMLPLFRFICRSRRMLGVALFLVWMISGGIVWWGEALHSGLRGFLMWGASTEGLFYCLTGMAIGSGLLQMKSLPHAYSFILLGFGLAVLLAEVLGMDGHQFPFSLKSVYVPPILVSVWNLWPDMRLPAWTSHLSFPIYVMHVIFTSYTGAIARFLDIKGAVIFLVQWVICIALTIVVTCSIRRLFPSFSGWVFGGR